MSPEKQENRQETEKKSPFNLPASESFLDPNNLAVWPETVAENRSFLEQIRERGNLCEKLDTVFDRLPHSDISMDIAIGRGIITEEQLENAYESLSHLLGSGDSDRIILYLPFELLPDQKWQPVSEKLRQAVDHFRQAYLKAWRGLLGTHDVRANFVDGDIIEVSDRVGDLPRVVKAAHLLPILVEKGLLKVQEIINIAEESEDEVLRQSVADTLPVLADLKLLPEEEIEALKNSKYPDIRDSASNLALEAPEKVATEQKEIKYSNIENELAQKFFDIESENYGNISEKRRGWLTKKKRQEALETAGNLIGTAISSDNLPDEELEHFLASDDPSIQIALIEGIRAAVESVAETNSEKAQEIYSTYKDALLTIWQKGDPSCGEALKKTFRRLYQANIVKQNELEKLNIDLPKLAGPFSSNLESIKEEVGMIGDMAKSIESNFELSQLVYPIAMVFGSLLKGYGARDADIDLAVFVKPGTSFGLQEKLQALLKQTFNSEKFGKEIMQFWLDQKDGNLVVHDFDQEMMTGESTWTHVLFGAAWEGDKNTIRELRNKLLTPYLFETDKKIRSIYLEELESDTLQYRLMHKGYEKFYPPCGGIHTSHRGGIDGESIFWDSGYRQLATKLFVKRVFLPKISVDNE